MQFVACLPDQGDPSDALRQVQAEAERLASPAHGQDEPFALGRDRLSRPLHCHVLICLIGVAHAGMRRLELSGGFQIGEELVTDHLNTLGVQGELPAFGGLLPLIPIWPGPLLQPGVLMTLATHVPDTGDFHLCRLQALARGRCEPTQSIDAYGLHVRSWPFVISRSVAQTSVLVKSRSLTSTPTSAR